MESALFPNMDNSHANMYLDSVSGSSVNVHLHLIYGNITERVRGELNYSQGKG
jgi:hypothetical protein